VSKRSEVRVKAMRRAAQRRARDRYFLQAIAHWDAEIALVQSHDWMLPRLGRVPPQEPGYQRILRQLGLSPLDLRS
jgi:hypothetical protein